MHNVDSVIGSLKTISHQEGLGIRRGEFKMAQHKYQMDVGESSGGRMLCFTYVHMHADAIQVSTVGLVPEMKRFMQETQGRHLLAVSLHASSDEKRSKIIPVNKRHSISEVRMKAGKLGSGLSQCRASVDWERV